MVTVAVGIAIPQELEISTIIGYNSQTYATTGKINELCGHGKKCKCIKIS